MILVNLPPRAKREAEQSWSPYHLERSVRLRNFGEPHTLRARGERILVNLIPRAKREAKGLRHPTTSSEASVLEILVNLPPRANREAQGFLVNLQHRVEQEDLRAFVKLSPGYRTDLFAFGNFFFIRS